MCRGTFCTKSLSSTESKGGGEREIYVCGKNSPFELNFLKCTYLLSLEFFLKFLKNFHKFLSNLFLCF